RSPARWPPTTRRAPTCGPTRRWPARSATAATGSASPSTRSRIASSCAAASTPRPPPTFAPWTWSGRDGRRRDIMNRFVTLGIVTAPAAGGRGGPSPAGGIAPQAMADALYAVMSSDRAVYAREVVNRLQNEEKVIKASEHFKDEKA